MLQNKLHVFVTLFTVERARRKKGGEEKKAKGLLFGFIMAALEIIFGRKNCLMEIKRGLFGGNLLKNPARYMCLGKKGVHGH